MKTGEQCKAFYPQQSWTWNPKLLWKFSRLNKAPWTNSVSPILNSEAIPMWKNNIEVWKVATRDYSAQISLMEVHILKAENDGLDAHAKNPYFNANQPASDQAYLNCLAS